MQMERGQNQPQVASGTEAPIGTHNGQTRLQFVCSNRPAVAAAANQPNAAAGEQ